MGEGSGEGSGLPQRIHNRLYYSAHCDTIEVCFMHREHQDPRSSAHFNAHYYPAANGQAAPSAASPSPNDLIMLEFLAAYYQLNCEYAQLVEFRNSPAAAVSGTSEQERLRAVERALV